MIQLDQIVNYRKNVRISPISIAYDYEKDMGRMKTENDGESSPDIQILLISRVG